MVDGMARPKRAERNEYGETKKPYQFLLTPTASALLDEVADEMGVTRSEALEMAIRGGGMKVAVSFSASKEGESK